MTKETVREQLNKWAGPMCIILVIIAGVNMYTENSRQNNTVDRIEDVQNCVIQYATNNGTNLQRRAQANDIKLKAQDDLLRGFATMQATKTEAARSEQTSRVAELFVNYLIQSDKSEEVKKDNPILDPPDCVREEAEKKD